MLCTLEKVDTLLDKDKIVVFRRAVQQGHQRDHTGRQLKHQSALRNLGQHRHREMRSLARK